MSRKKDPNGQREELKSPRRLPWASKWLPALLLLVIVLAFGAGAALGYAAWGRLTPAAMNPMPASSDTRTAPSPVASMPSQASGPSADFVGPDLRALGPVDAPVAIVEFSDFECPYCKRFHIEILPRILEAYKGKIRYVFRDFPLTRIHPYAGKAAEAARCAGEQGKFWEYAEALFKDEEELRPSTFTQIAADLGLDQNTFQACLDSGKYADAVQQDLQDGLRLGVQGTPTFFINGQMLAGAHPFSRFREVIDAALAPAR